MSLTIVKYKDWEFEVDRELTISTYKRVSLGGADTCTCNICKNYIACRDNVFPDEIKNLFVDLGVDYKKEVEIVSYDVPLNGLHNISGWFHFKGQVLSGKDYRVPLPGGGNGFTFDLTNVADNFSIGFAEGNDLTHFADKTGLVQIEFNTNIPWVIAK